MQVKLVSVVVMWVMSLVSAGQVDAAAYRSVSSNAWSMSLTWEIQVGPIWLPTLSVPGTGDVAIVRHRVTVTLDTSVGTVVVKPNACLRVDSSELSITDPDGLTVDGELELLTAGRLDLRGGGICEINGMIELSSTAKLRISSLVRLEGSGHIWSQADFGEIQIDNHCVLENGILIHGALRILALGERGYFTNLSDGEVSADTEGILELTGLKLNDEPGAVWKATGSMGAHLIFNAIAALHLQGEFMIDSCATIHVVDGTIITSGYLITDFGRMDTRIEGYFDDVTIMPCIWSLCLHGCPA